MAGHAIVTQAAPTSAPPQTQNYTKSGLGTPKGAFFIGSLATALNSGADSAGMCLGGTDFTDEGVAWASDEDNVASTNSGRVHQSDHSIHMAAAGGSGTATESATENGTVTDGLQLSWDQTSVARYVSAILFNEGIANFDFQNVDAGTGTTTVTVGFQADVVILFGCSVATDFSAGNAEQMIAFYDRANDTIVNTGHRVNDNRDLTTVDTQTGCAFNPSAGEIYTQLNAFGSASDRFTIGNFTSTSFDLVRTQGTATKRLGMIAMKLDTGYYVKVGTVNAPTSTGATDLITGLTGTPQLAILTGTPLTSASASATTCAWYLGAYDGTDDMAACYWSEDAVSTVSNAGQHHRDDSGIYVTNDQGTAISVATLGFENTKVTANFSTATTGVLLGYLVISKEQVGETVNRVLTENTVVTDPVPGYQLTQERPANSNISLLTDAAFLYYTFARLVAEYFPATDAYVMQQNLRRDIVDIIGSSQQLEYPSIFSEWSGTAIVTSDSDLDPDGQLTADTLEDNNPVGILYRRTDPRLGYVTGSNVSFSVHVKKDSIPKSTRHAAIRGFFNSGVYLHLHFDTSTGEVNPIDAGAGVITDYGYEDDGDYRRFYFTGNDGGSGSDQYYMDIYPAAGFGLSNYDIAAVGSIVAWGAMINDGGLIPYESGEAGIADVIQLIHERFRQVSDNIALTDNFVKQISIGDQSETFFRTKKDNILLADSVAATFLGTTDKQLSDSLLVNEAAFLQRFKRHSVADQIAIASELLNMTRNRVRRVSDSALATDNVVVTEFRIRNITTLDAFSLVDLLDQEVTGIRRKKLRDTLTAGDTISHEQGSTLQPSVRIEVGIEER